MNLSPKRNGILLEILHHFKTQTLLKTDRVSALFLKSREQEEYRICCSTSSGDVLLDRLPLPQPNNNNKQHAGDSATTTVVQPRMNRKPRIWWRVASTFCDSKKMPPEDDWAESRNTQDIKKYVLQELNLDKEKLFVAIFTKPYVRAHQYGIECKHE